ncbi:MAG TPA: PhoX family phosphatase, partial [Methylophaga sp.]|nr:PhoX family phosphatase [Methylophaga sp.]
ETNPANPRQPNLYGHLLRFNEVDATSTEFTWEVFVLAGGEEHGATINGDIFANPDGLMIDQ